MKHNNLLTKSRFSTGKIIVNRTFEELKKLFPPAKIEYVKKQPSLEEIFLSIIGKKEDHK